MYVCCDTNIAPLHGAVLERPRELALFRGGGGPEAKTEKTRRKKVEDTAEHCWPAYLDIFNRLITLGIHRTNHSDMCTM